MSALRYVYPEVVTVNFGDRIIDHAVRKLLARHFPEPAARCDPYAGAFPSGDYDCLVVPGITHLTAGKCPGLERVAALPYPTYCLSGSVWQPLPPPGLLLRTRVLRRARPEPDLRVARVMRPPIGARDPYTLELLSRHGIPSLYTGCATLQLPPEGVADDGFVLMSFGRGHVRTQTRAGHALARTHEVIGICHEVGDAERYRAAGWRLPLVTYRGDLEAYLSYFKRARLVVTGRLHGALPALAYGKKVFCFGDRDTRTTLLDDLGVTVHSRAELASAPRRASAAFNRGLLAIQQANWERLFEAIERGRRSGLHAARAAEGGE